jgi:hypothetical protein
MSNIFNLLLDPNWSTVKLPYGLPSLPFTWIGEHYSVPYLTLNEIQYSIRQAFEECEGITSFEWFPKSSYYIIEYGSMPLERTVSSDLSHIIRRKKQCSTEAADIAYEKFYKHQNQDQDDYLLEFPTMRRKWSKSVLNIYWYRNKNCIEIEFRRISGDRVSSIYLGNLLKEHFIKIQKTQKDLTDALEEAGIDIKNTDLREYLVRDVI